MTDRRRNLFVLLLVAGLLVASLAVIATKPTRLGLDLKGGVSLIYQAKPTKQSAVTGDAIDRSLDIMRKRVDQIGVAEPEPAALGRRPDRRLAARRQERRRGGLAGRHHRPDVVLRLGGQRPRAQLQARSAEPERDRRARRPATRSIPPALSLFDAVTRGAKCPRTNTGKESSGDKFYLVDKERKQRPRRPRREPRRPAEGGAEQEDPLRRQAGRQGPAGRRHRPRRAARPQGQAAAGLVRAQGPADPRRHGHQEPRAGLRQRPGRERPAERHLRLHRPGRGRVVEVHAQARPARPGVRARRVGRRRSNQHFAITLDNELISVPQIDWHQYPDGLGGGQGSRISGGFTIESAQRLANLLKTGALPIKLELISASQVSATLGKQALNQGLIAGVVGLHHRRALPADLLPRAGRHRGRRPRRLRDLLLRADQARADHDDAAGHRGPDPHHRRRGRREHRHLRTRQGGAARRADRSRPPSRRATSAACRRSSTPTS